MGYKETKLCACIIFSWTGPPLLYSTHVLVLNIPRKNSHLASSKTRYFTIYPQVVNVLLKKYLTDKTSLEAESGIKCFLRSSSLKPSQYTEKLMTKTLRCRDVYVEYSLNEMIIVELDLSIHHSIHERYRGWGWRGAARRMQIYRT